MVTQQNRSAVAYYRMSSDRQEESIPGQRAEVVAYAERNGYRILREYVEEGISGDATERRLQFQRMIADCAKLKDARAVLCWDQDRFGRFDPLEAGYWIKPLRDAGVGLVTVMDGPTDWDSFAGRIAYTVRQEGKHAYLLDLSKNVLRGQLLAARDGKRLGGPTPYAYRADPEQDKLVLGDPLHVEVIRWLFWHYARKGWSLRQLADELNARHTPSPATVRDPSKPKQWTPQTVHGILTNRVYVGDQLWNRRHRGSYHGVQDGRIQATRKGERRRNPEGEWQVKEQAHEPLVSRDLFGEVQAMLPRRQKSTGPTSKGEAFLFSGLLVCGHCGRRLHGTADANGNRNRGKLYRSYFCPGYTQHRACHRHVIREDELLGDVLHVLQTIYLAPKRIRELEIEAQRQRQDTGRARTGEEAKGKARLAELRKMIDQGNTNLALLPSDRLPGVVAKLRGWEQEQEQIEAALLALSEENAKPAGDAEQFIKDAVANLWQLREAIAEAKDDPATLRVVLEELIDHVALYWDHRQTAQQTRTKLRAGFYGDLVVRSPGQNVGLVREGPPFLIMHGDKDALVPLSQSERLAEALKKAGVEVTLKTLEGAGHGGPAFTNDESRKLIGDFFDKHLKKKANK